MVLVTVCAYGIYLTTVLRRADGVPLADITYEPALLWTIGGAIAAGIALNIAAAIAFHGGADHKDQRDREIGRFGEHIGQSFLVTGAVAALAMALLELDHFWIANVIYLGFVLSALLASAAKIVAYRKGFHPW